MLTRPVTPTASENREAARKAREAATNEQRALLESLTSVYNELATNTVSPEEYQARREAERQPFPHLDWARARVAESIQEAKCAPEDGEPTLEEAA